MLAHLGSGGGAFALAKLVQHRDGFGGSLADGLGDGLVEILFGIRREYARQAQGGIQIGLAFDAVQLPRLPEGAHVGVHQGAIPDAAFAGRGAEEADMHLHVAARHALLEDAADVVLEGSSSGGR